MNILHLSAVQSWGGGERHIENLCRELAFVVPTFDNHIFCIKNTDFHKRLKENNFKIIAAPLAFKMDPRYFLKLGAVCKSGKYDLLHIHDSTALTLAIMADKIVDLPPFIFSKKTSFPIRPRKQTLYKYNYPKIRKILCVSEATLKTTSKNIENPEKLTTIYHGTSLRDKCDKAPYNLREFLNLKKETVIIGNIANHIWPKNLEIFIKCADEILNKWKKQDFHFVQIGSFTGLSSRLKALLKKYHLEKNISFMGHIPDAANFIPQFDVSLMTSESEGVPQFIYESFYHKVPVVSTDVGGIPEVIESHKNGLLALKGDYKKLAEHIIYLIKNPQEKEKFTNLSKNRLHNEFTSEMMAFQTLQEYKKVLNGTY